MLGNQPFNLGNMFRTALSFAGVGPATGQPVQIPGQAPMPTGGVVDVEARKAAVEALTGSRKVQADVMRLSGNLNRLQHFAHTAFAVGQALSGFGSQSTGQQIGSLAMVTGQLAPQAAASIASGGFVGRGLGYAGIGGVGQARLAGFLGAAGTAAVIADLVTKPAQIAGDDQAAMRFARYNLYKRLIQAPGNNAQTITGLAGLSASGYGGATAQVVGDLVNQVGWNASAYWGLRWARQFFANPETANMVMEGMLERRQAVVGAFKTDPLFLAKMTGQTADLARWRAQLDSLEPERVSRAMFEIAAKFDLSNSTAIAGMADDFKTHIHAQAAAAEVFNAQARARAKHRRVRELMN